MTLAHPSSDELTEARSLRISDWPEFLRLAELNATVPLVHSNLERAGLPVPQAMHTVTAAVAARNEARLAVARELMRRFLERRIPVVLLKGVLFAETIYRNPGYKKMNDVDILVRKSDMDAVYDVYREMRFWSAAELLGGSAKKQEKYSHHAPPFFSRDLACMVGTHWGLITPLSPYTLDYDAIWSRVVDVDFYGHPAKAMCPEDNLHHLCVHLPYYKTGLRELADIYNLVRHQPIDWELFHREVAKARTESLCYHALSLANAVMPSHEMQAAIGRLEPSRFVRRDVAHKIANVPQLLRSRCTHLSVIEKHFADLRADKKWSSFFGMWRGMLWPPAEDVAKITGSAGLWGRLLAPSRIRRVFYRDVGRLLFWVIMAKCAWDVVKASFVRPPPRDLAAELGVTAVELHRLKEALE